MEKQLNKSERPQNSSNEISNHPMIIDCQDCPTQEDQEIIIKQLACEVQQQVKTFLWINHPQWLMKSLTFVSRALVNGVTF